MNNDGLVQPADSRWTAEQWRAIVTRGHDVLVAAAAGSGKTAVLVERIVRLISNERQPIDIDRLLVSTFTKAAADEMRHRIRAALEKALAAEPTSAHLRRQLALVHRASITTLHSFCMEVIRRNFHRTSLDPGFRIANETEAELLRQDALEALFEHTYGVSEPEDPFWELLDCYGGERSDDKLFALVLRLYDFSRSHPFPEQWLREAAGAFALDGEQAHRRWTGDLLADIGLELEGMHAALQEALRLCGQPGGPAAYIATIEQELALVGELLRVWESGEWEPLREAFAQAAFGRLKPARGDDLDAALQEQVKALRSQCKDRLEAIRDDWMSRTMAEYVQELQRMAPMLQRLAALTESFGERYTEAKAEKRLIDFSDLEHYCLAILCDGIDEQGRMIPSEAAGEYCEYYKEVLVDEYQDTNQVQEAIISLVSRRSPGNRFMVGDVKQSIYRFRLADPGIFLEKYNGFRAPRDAALSVSSGEAVDLARNFRSRCAVVDTVNLLFRQLMQQRTAELDYDEAAELVYGADYESAAGEAGRKPGAREGGGAALATLADDDMLSAEVVVIRRSGDSNDDEEAAEAAEAAEAEKAELETAELEARFIALKIKEMVGELGRPLYVSDREGSRRRAAYGDCVILLRATKQWAPVFVEQLRQYGIPAHADLTTGYFEATEIEVMLALLNIIDNPLQDIPFAAVLRSPIVGLDAGELARVRLIAAEDDFYGAASQYAQSGDDARLRRVLAAFLERLERWREQARQGALSDLLWRLYRETGYYDYAGGLPGGAQRQANLKALYDRARQFEATSLRGLFRFLRFIRRMQENGSDLGAAKPLGEQVDAVRIMSIHKSKGLEFPIVFVAGLAKPFNEQDSRGDFLMHNKLGFGPRFVDAQLRVSYPSLANLAIGRKIRNETMAEEMRILYVALTRAREKLIMLGTTKNGDRLLSQWNAYAHTSGWALPAHAVTKARSYLDWIGPAIIRHPSLQSVRELSGLVGGAGEPVSRDWTRLTFSFVAQGTLAASAEAAATRQAQDELRLYAVRELEPAEPSGQPQAEETLRRLEWEYAYPQASSYYSKTTVTELKRLREDAAALDEHPTGALADAERRPDASYERVRSAFGRRPRFLEQRKLSAAERGTVYHAIMQYMPLDRPVTAETVAEAMERMILLELLTREQCDEADPRIICAFFATDIGRRLLESPSVRREAPFSYGLPVGELHMDADDKVREETVLIQGVIDCLFEEPDGLVLLDFKTDAIKGEPAETAEKYRVQLDLYARAIEAISGQPVKEKALYFFDGSALVHL